jgi:hypothetical protein
MGAIAPEEGSSMKRRCLFCIAGLILAGCTPDPYAPINQTTPIRQMDNVFEGRPMNAPPPGYAYPRERVYDNRPY